MASEIHMPGPECLIENTNGRLLVNPKALKILSAIRQPVVVVAIVGLYHTGKSYLVNKLAGKNKGFSLGSTVQSHTKGIWMWCVPHPKKPNRTLVLLDTEGLGDVEKGDNQNDSWIFALAILLSSTFVYNSMGTINQQAMDQLHYVTELADRIRARSSPDVDGVEDSADFVSFFPDFVWTLRDFSLDLEADGQSITADEYLENSLKLRKGTSPKDKTFNMPRLCIRKFFPKKKCFIFDQPTHKKKSGHLEKLCDEELDSEFVQQAAAFCSYIFSNSKTKTLSGGIKVDGPRLGTLVQTYVNAINSGDLPCMENAVLALAEIENSAAVQKAIAHYDQQMGQKLQLPTETLQELLDVHRATEKETIEVFMRSSFKDIDQLFQKELVAQLDKKREDFCNQNRKASSDRCSALLKDIFSPLEEDVKQGIYSKSGGYRLFIEKKQELKKKYLQELRKGIQADEILQEYLKSKESMTDAILQTDQTLSEKEKLIEEERMKAECARATAKMLEQMQIKNQQMMEQKEKSYQEHVKQLTEKMERERAQLPEEQERTLALKLQESKQDLGYEWLKQKSKHLVRDREVAEPLHLSWEENRLRDMASEIHMPGPECLIENTNGRLLVNPKALKILSAIRQPVVVVAIVGLYHTGKSYLMNKLAGKNKGFSLGSTVQSHTKGIWMWCVPHPKKPNRTLVLLDTEGLGDVEKGDNQNDSWIFALAILLSSTFVYNSVGTINQQAMDQLHYVTELTDRIRARSSPDVDGVEDSADFVSFFPDFVWTLRDFSLDLQVDGQSITADEYLENSLKLRKGTSPKDKTFNMPRLCIRKFFPKKKCFIFDRPTHRKKLGQLEELCDDELDPEFVQQTAVFCSYIFGNSKTKTLSGGIKVDGPRLKTLVQTYVNAINSGDLPCMESAVLALAEIENSAAVQKAIAHYDQQMGQKLQLPAETLQELLDLHWATEKEAIEVFMKHSFKDVDQVFQKKLGDKLEAKLDDLCKQNMKAFSDFCWALIQGIFHPLYEDVKQGTFSKPEGYYLFVKKMIELKYHQVPRKGVQAGETLRKYLDSKEGVADALLETDQSLTEKEKETEVERMKSEAAEAANKMLEEMQKKNEQMMQKKEVSYQELVKQRTEKMEKETKRGF